MVPTQHYFMGGVWVDRDSATTMPHLFAAGETSCNGVHGKNRLASNSLLESLVFARRAAHVMCTGESLEVELAGEPALDGRHRAVGEGAVPSVASAVADFGFGVASAAAAGEGPGCGTGPAPDARGTSGPATALPSAPRPLAIDALCDQLGTVAHEPVACGDAPLDINIIGKEA